MLSKSLTAFNNKDFEKIRRDSSPKKEFAVKFLIVSEGKETEKLYFQAFEGKSLRNASITTVCKGIGQSPLHVVETAIRLKNQAVDNKTPFESVWAVFDHDDFTEEQWNEAISLGERNHVRCAWSNQAFELWYILHFENRSVYTHRTEHEAIINAHLGKHMPGFAYDKADPNMLRYLDLYGDELAAVRWAKAKMVQFWHAGIPSYHRNPCTAVYRLVNVLRGRDWKFNEKIKLLIKKQANQIDKDAFSKKQLKAFKRTAS